MFIQSISAKGSKNYPQAKQYGRNALILTIVNIIFTMILTLLIIGLTVGYSCADGSAYNYYTLLRYSREFRSLQLQLQLYIQLCTASYIIMRVLIIATRLQVSHFPCRLQLLGYWQLPLKQHIDLNLVSWQVHMHAYIIKL